MQTEHTPRNDPPFRNALLHFQEGERAFWSGEHRLAAPHGAGTRQLVAWQAGWDSAEEDCRHLGCARPDQAWSGANLRLGRDLMRAKKGRQRARAGNPVLATILLACGLTTPVAAEEVTAVTLAQTARLSGDAIIADACHLRPRAWVTMSVPAIMQELNRQAKDVSPSGGVDPGGMPAFLYASLNQAVDEGTVQFARYHQAACKAIEDDGSLMAR